MKKSIIFIVILLLIVAVGVVGFWYYRDKVFSKEILKLEILGSETANMGDEITYTIKYKNNGNFVLESPKLVFELPLNSLTEEGKTRLTKDLKDIYPGDENFVQFKTGLLGKEGDLKVAHAWLSYTPKNLSARYESDTTFTTKINMVPLTLDFDLPSKAEKGKEITYSINYFSNIDYPLDNLSIKVVSANGFNFESSDPVSLDHTEWKLATLNKVQGGRISIKGLVNADAGSHVLFFAQLGRWQNGSFIVIKEATKDVEVISPLLFISQRINSSANYIASPGENLHYEIFFRNIGSTPFDNLFIISKLDGLAFDLSTLTSNNGSVRPNDNLIVWDAKQVSDLQNLSPNEESKVEFDVKLKNTWTPSDSEKNNTLIKNEVKISDISQDFSTKVNSSLVLSQKAYHATQDGIENFGPIPPQVNSATTYTITWQVKNYFNDVKNVKVRARLPEGVNLTAKIMPETQISKFSLDSTSREIVWSAGDMPAGTGVIGSLPSISFQVSLTPSFLMQGKLAGLIGQATVSGEDQFTGKVIQSVVSGVNTDLPDDQANSGGGIVK